MVDVGVLVKGGLGRMAPRLFVSRFVSGCYRRSGCGLQDMGYGTLAIGQGP